MDQTYYQLLSVDMAASAEAISTAYFSERAKLNAAGDITDPAFAEALRLLNEAYETLIDPELRAAYDRQIGAPPDTSRALMVTTPSLLQPASVADFAPESARPHKTCSVCGTLNPQDVIMCIICNTQIGRPCPKCGHTLALQQPVCDRCGSAVNEIDRQRYGESLAIQQHIQADRREGEMRTSTLNRLNAADARNTTVFWLVASFGCGLLLFLAYFALQYFQ